jgi:hypothetical protein
MVMQAQLPAQLPALRLQTMTAPLLLPGCCLLLVLLMLLQLPLMSSC